VKRLQLMDFLQTQLESFLEKVICVGDIGKN